MLYVAFLIGLLIGGVAGYVLGVAEPKQSRAK